MMRATICSIGPGVGPVCAKSVNVAFRLVAMQYYNLLVSADPVTGLSSMVARSGLGLSVHLQVDPATSSPCIQPSLPGW